MNTSYYADINSILNVFRLSEEEADRLINSVDDYDYDEFEEEVENEEEEIFG